MKNQCFFAAILFIWCVNVFSVEAQDAKKAISNDLDFKPAVVVAEITSHVEKSFYDKKFDFEKWMNAIRLLRLQAEKATTQDQFAKSVNGMLAGLNASHTKYFSKLDPQRYQILGVFHQLFESDRSDLFVYDGIGIDSRLVGGRRLISAVFDGFSASEAGLVFGDEIVSVAGKPFRPILSFAGMAGRSVQVSIVRGGTTKEVLVEVESLDGRTMFEKALESSIRIIKRNGKKIGYVHVWSYAGMKYQTLLKNAVVFGELADCDSLILDIRDGWGGADFNYLKLFRDPIAEVQSIPRDGEGVKFSGTWNKPVVLVTNGGSTSGKELFAFGFKKMGMGRVIGENTAGAVLAGRCILLSNNDMLYLAVMDIRIDGQRLEGRGVAPDVVIPRPLINASKIDPQVEKAIEYLIKS